MASASGHLDVHLVGSAAAIVRRSAKPLLRLLQSRFSCEAEILGLDLDSDPGPKARPVVVPEQRFETTLPSGVKVSVWKADLANFTVDAVVNAANSQLQHGGGLAFALSEAGGPQVQRESDDFIRVHGDVKTGDAVALGPGKLKCKTIIHAVGPKLSFRPNPHQVSAAKPQLERAVRSILETVETKQLNKVAIPAISSGIYNFPLEECAEVVVSTIKKFYGSHTSHRFKPKEVLLVNNDDPTVREMEWACLKLLPAPVSLSQTPSGSRAHASAASYSQVTASGVHTRGAKGGTKHPEIQLGPVRVLLRKGCLEEQKMDVIVNTIGSDRQLNAGQVSKTLLKKAGPKMQQEIFGAILRGTVFITKGYGLDCKEVYHACCPFKNMTGSDQTLFRCVQDSLWLAAAAQHGSIAFPAIGTGNLGFWDREAAQIMLNAVWTFAQNSPVVIDVHFVIFHADRDRFKAFEAELNSLRPKAFQMEPPQSPAQEAHVLNTKPALPSSPEQGWGLPDQKAPTEPCVRLLSLSERCRTEAKAWLQNLLYGHLDTVVINNNFTQLLGERDMEELSQTEVEGVQVEEFLEKGRSGLMVRGDKVEDIAVAALKIQHMLQEVQKMYLKEEVEELKMAAQSKVKMEKSSVFRSDPQIKPLVRDLERQGLQLLKAERVENPALEKVFKLQKSQMSSSVELLQLVPAQFCDMVSHIGFRPECAPPDESSLGEGLYFADDVKTALRLWTHRSDQFLYLFVAEVLKGRPRSGRPGLVLAPGPDQDCVESSGVTVIFNQDQALPRFLLTCSTEASSSSV